MTKEEEGKVKEGGRGGKIKEDLETRQEKEGTLQETFRENQEGALVCSSS